MAIFPQSPILLLTVQPIAMSWTSLFTLPPHQRLHHRLHLIGIGGAGLAPIASVLLEMGFQVSGSDQSPSERTAALAQVGAVVHQGHHASYLQSSLKPNLPDLVLISSAVPASNPELAAAHAAGIPVVKRQDLLGPLTAGRKVIAVAGTHGKTTTTGMIAHLLAHSGFSPGYIIGSTLPDLGASALGSGPYFVIEADEYDDAFLGLRPDLIVLTNIDWDHPDCFPTAGAYESSFRRFAGNLQPGGHVVYCYDDPILRALASEQEGSRWHGYGSRSASGWVVRNIEIGKGQTTYDLRLPGGGVQPVCVAVPGLHNALNSAAALISVTLIGIPVAAAAPLLAGFRGAGRRFEVKGEADGVLIVDDYAHHPTEIRTTLAAARAAYPDREIWAVYQPHTYSRTRALLDRFDGAFAASDHVLVTDIYAAREPEDVSVTPAQVVAASRHPQAQASGTLVATLATLAANVRPGSLVIILSAGSATDLAPALLEQLAESALYKARDHG